MFSAMFCIVHPVILQIIHYHYLCWNNVRYTSEHLKIRKCCILKWNFSRLSSGGCRQTTQSPVGQHLSAAATFSALQVVLFLVGSKYLHNSSICPACVGLIGIVAEWLANHICYLMKLPADTFIYLLGSFFYLCSQLLLVPFWSYSPWILHSRVSLSTVWILILISLSFCVNCTCFRFNLLELVLQDLNDKELIVRDF